VAREFLTWLGVPPGGLWLDVGSGTGALSGVILEVASPRAVVGIDSSPGYVAYASSRVVDPRARFEVGDARALPVATAHFDAVVSGLVLNFVPDPALAVAEMARAARPGGRVAAYVWDYAGQMELMRRFWDAAVALVRGAGLRQVEARAIDVPTVFRDFDDYWTPFLGGQGPAPSYTAALSEARRDALRERIRAALPIASDGSISLIGRAWAVRGESPATTAG
jgi:SAM-dependent methyltransferase